MKSIKSITRRNKNNNEEPVYKKKIFYRFNKILKNKKVIFLDLDGTVYIGDKLIKGAKKFLDYIQKKRIYYYFITNNSSCSKLDYVKKLKNLGIHITEDRIILSTDGVIKFLLKEKIKNLYILGTNSMKEMFIKEGFNVESKNPEYIILGYDKEITYEKIKTAAIFLQKGVKLIATHCDIVCPSSEGLLPDVGSMLALFEKATNKKPIKIFGKPNKEMIIHIMKKLKVSSKEIAIIGDRIYTDMALARTINCDFILVLSGETNIKEIKKLDKPPKFIVENIGNIIQQK